VRLLGGIRRSGDIGDKFGVGDRTAKHRRAHQ